MSGTLRPLSFFGGSVPPNSCVRAILPTAEYVGPMSTALLCFSTAYTMPCFSRPLRLCGGCPGGAYTGEILMLFFAMPRI